jgi:uracil phosphoribosyltransferase
VLKKNGVREDRVVFVNLVSCPEGLRAVVNEHPKITIITGEIDDGLNENKFILPGLGDFGCRYFGTDE